MFKRIEVNITEKEYLAISKTADTRHISNNHMLITTDEILIKDNKPVALCNMFGEQYNYNTFKYTAYIYE